MVSHIPKGFPLWEEEQSIWDLRAPLRYSIAWGVQFLLSKSLYNGMGVGRRTGNKTLLPSPLFGEERKREIRRYRER
jgi:hypothetical protein